VVHLAPDLRSPETTTDEEFPSVWPEPEIENGFELAFSDELDEGDEELYAHSRNYLFGDYNYPCVDISSESARTMVWDEEERVLRNERGAWFSPIRGAKGQVAIRERERPAWEGYGAVSYSSQQNQEGSRPSNKPFYDDEEHAGDRVIDHGMVGNVIPDQPTDVKMKWTRTRKQQHASGSSTPSRLKETVQASDAVDLIVEDSHAADEENVYERRKGETTIRPLVSSHLTKVYRRGSEEEEEVGDDEGGDVSRPRVESDASRDRGVIARVMTPPLHARVHYDDIPDNDNPWA